MKSLTNSLLNTKEIRIETFQYDCIDYTDGSTKLMCSFIERKTKRVHWKTWLGRRRWELRETKETIMKPLADVVKGLIPKNAEVLQVKFGRGELDVYFSIAE